MTGNKCWFCNRTEQEVEDEIGYVMQKDGTPVKNMFYVIANKDDERVPNVPLYFCRACGIIIDHLSGITIKRGKIEEDKLK